MLRNAYNCVCPANETERAYLESLIREDFNRCHPGETLEITGIEVNFEGVQSIFARKIKRGADEYLFRDNDGKPIW